MFGFGVKIETNGPIRDAKGGFMPSKVKEPIDRSIYKNLYHAAAALRKYAASLIQKAPEGEPSAPGKPPHTHRRIFYRRALRFFVDKQKEEALVGFQFTVIGETGATHEFGELRDGTQFPARPTLGPALDANAARLGSQWQGSIGA